MRRNEPSTSRDQDVSIEPASMIYWLQGWQACRGRHCCCRKAGYCCAVLFFGSVHAMRSLGRCVMASFFPTSQYVCACQFFCGRGRRAGYALTGVQSSPRDMCSLLLASRGGKGRRRAGAAPSRRGQTHFSFQEGLSYPDGLYHQQLLLQLALHTETRGRGSRAPSSTRRPTTTRARRHCRRPARRRGQRRRLPRERDIGTIRGGPSIPRSSARRRWGGAYRG